ncbi:hypothetical protein [Paraburkholderia nemoris]|jgi:hypothetical protein|uniref:Uncharacterized protein n=1 Tax=Paraburkholderia nemoris TaxID=2793076 RepID=A0ABN7MCN0_9BURK|nr:MULTISPECIES: hypothetical protein [Paraburkholderia]KPD18369.1 hypothetical protein ADM96_12815 [Burkholderia sp. ST111]MBK5146847.1 hypothetical protein [Burkholderia sp. R-69608]MBK3742689.1 hypothetical protein [Paraburkholderia aspalathi]MBK3779551.1 hypothetical protein [Paraburkholderia aspalathi]MBK3813524.1 hypothetical protein [Paraburkholderia aspalathi]
MPQGNTGGATMVDARATYVLELARGCSYISSTLSPETRDSAIAEVLGEFRELYGEQEGILFQRLLAEDLQRRGRPNAAAAVLAFKFISP